MEPTELYNRSKRNLAIFAAALALVLFQAAEVHDGGQLLPFKVRPEAIPTILFFGVGYLLYQFLLARTFQTDEVRKRTKLDFIITTSLSTLAMLAYLVFYLAWQVLGLSWGVLSALAAIAGAAFASAITFLRYSDLIKWRREAINLRTSTIEQRLRTPGWILNYNPKFSDKQKPISFEDDGSIGAGQNRNEFQWRLEGDRLDLIQHDGQVHNTFKYDPATDQFKASGPSRLRIDGQYIYRVTGDT